jgi:Ca-activated chloride channel family protein
VGGTAFYDAIHAAFRVVEDSEKERRAFVLLTDGEDTESAIDLDAIKEEARASEVTIYGIGLDVGIGEGRTALRRLARDTGGRAFFVDDAEELGGTYDEIAEELRSLYQVVYASDNETFDGRFVEVDIDVRSDEHEGLEARHRRGYYALP